MTLTSTAICAGRRVPPPVAAGVLAGAVEEAMPGTMEVLPWSGAWSFIITCVRPHCLVPSNSLGSPETTGYWAVVTAKF